MDDGASGSIVWFILLLLLEMLFYGFGSALSNMKGADKDETEKEESGRLSAKQLRLTYLTEHHAQYAGAIQLGAVTVNLLMGALYLYRLNSYFGYIVYRAAVHNIGNLVEWQITLFAVLTAILVTLILLYIVLTFGISIPKKTAARNPDRWLGIFITPIY